jgi:hypothetical protein
METSASFEARSAPPPHQTTGRKSLRPLVSRQCGPMAKTPLTLDDLKRNQRGVVDGGTWVA